MTWNITSSDLSTQWQDVDATSTLYDIAVAMGIDQLSADNIVFGTRAQWQAQPSFQPELGQVVVWLDKDIVVSTDSALSTEVEVAVPGLKVGNGNAYNLDLPFVGDDIAYKLYQHVQSDVVHLSGNERQVWNHKITVGSIYDPEDDGVVDETLVITRG